MEVWHILGPKTEAALLQSSDQHQAYMNEPLYELT
jgi:hypothetical protein